MKNFKIGDKLTRFPLIQGGMGVGISLGRLAGTVAKEGGIGIISTAQIGYREKDFDRNTEEANQRAILSEMKKARRISPDGIIGYNIMVALKEYASHVKAAVQAGADRPHCLNGQICKGYPEILGKKVQAHCRPCGDRRSPGRRSSGLPQGRAGFLYTGSLRQ